jgi:hypothetical protein
MEWTRTSFEQSVAEFCTILLEEHFQVALKMSEFFLALVSKTGQSGSIMLKSHDCAGEGRC